MHAAQCVHSLLVFSSAVTSVGFLFFTQCFMFQAELSNELGSLRKRLADLEAREQERHDEDTLATFSTLTVVLQDTRLNLHD
jgi:hypothetical protein